MRSPREAKKPAARILWSKHKPFYAFGKKRRPRWNSALQLLLVYRRDAHAQRQGGALPNARDCAPGLVMQTRLVGLNLGFRALTSAATVRAPPGRKKPMPHSTHLAGTAAKMAARRNAISAVMVAAVVRRRIKKGYWVFCGFTLGGKVLGRLKYLCFIPDMSSELFRALTSAATRRWCVGGWKTLLILDAAGRGLPALPDFDRFLAKQTLQGNM